MRRYGSARSRQQLPGGARQPVGHLGCQLPFGGGIEACGHGRTPARRYDVRWNVMEILRGGHEMAHVSGSVPIRELLAYLDEVLQPAGIKDYSPNGLQVEGRETIGRIVTAVTATRTVIEAAVARGADALLVHHGYFWKGEDPRVIGMKKGRLAALLKADINLIAYHLPLDVHPELGNNARLGGLLGWPVDAYAGEMGLIARHRLPAPIGAGELASLLAQRLEREPLLVGDLEQPIRGGLVYRGGAGFPAGGHRPGGRCLHQRRDLRAHHPSGPGGRGDLRGCRSPRHRAWRHPGAGRSSGRSFRPGGGIRRRSESGVGMM